MIARRFTAILQRHFSTTSVCLSTKGTKFNDRETAAENKYAREHDQELLKKLRKDKEAQDKKKPAKK